MNVTAAMVDLYTIWLPGQSDFYQVHLYTLKRYPKGRLVWKRDFSFEASDLFFASQELAIDYIKSKGFILLKRKKVNYWHFWFKDGDLDESNCMHN